MSNKDQQPSQNLDFDNLQGGHGDLNNLSSSSSSSSSQPPVSAYRTLLRFKEAAGFGNQAEFFCPAMAKKKIEPLS
jgi:hypothetical protein